LHQQPGTFPDGGAWTYFGTEQGKSKNASVTDGSMIEPSDNRGAAK